MKKQSVAKWILLLVALLTNLTVFPSEKINSSLNKFSFKMYSNLNFLESNQNEYIIRNLNSSQNEIKQFERIELFCSETKINSRNFSEFRYTDFPSNTFQYSDPDEPFKSTEKIVNRILMDSLIGFAAGSLVYIATEKSQRSNFWNYPAIGIATVITIDVLFGGFE